MNCYVAIEEVLAITKRRREINKLNFGDIIWTKNGKPIKIGKETIDKFGYTGLCNIDFITSGEYKIE